MKRMKRWGMALLAALTLTAGAARAEIAAQAEPDGHITASVVIDGKNVAVDADVYGGTVQSVQAYRVWPRNYGESPADERLWLGDSAIADRKAKLTENDLYMRAESGARLWLTSYLTRFEGVNRERLDAEGFYFLKLYDWADDTNTYPEAVELEELEGFSVGAAIQKLAPMMDALGVALEARPFYGFTLSLERLKAATEAHLDYGVNPTETIVEDWSAADEHYRLRLPTRFHGLSVMPWRAVMNTLAGEEATDASVFAWISRQGVELMDVSFVPGREEAVGEPFAPISAQEALDVCAREAKSRSEEWGLGEKNRHYTGVNNPRIASMTLGYVLCPQGSDGSCLARPAWFFRVAYDTVALHAVSDWGDGPVEHEEAETWAQIVAVDAQTGEMLLYW